VRDKTPAVPKPAPANSIVAAAPASKPEMTDAPIVAAEPPQKTVYRENWLQAQSPSQYTIQLIGVRSEPTLLRFIAENLSSLNRQQIAYYRSNYKSEDWFPLLYGVYASKTEARSAIDGLPENIRKQSPWIRTLAAVQNDIKRRKKP
jgi:DamX protein